MHTVALNAQHYGQGPAVILLHGLFGSLTNLGVLAKLLAEQFQVIAVDLRNHGDSPHADSMSYSLMAEDITQLMTTMGIENAHLIGHSMGGKAAMQLALSHPERVNKLVIADIAPVSYQANGHKHVLDGLNALAEAPPTSRNEADRRLSQYVPEAGVRAFLLKNLTRNADGRFGLKLNLASIIANYQSEINQAPQGIPFEGPTLFIKGSESDYIQESHRSDINRLFPNAALKVIQGTGHWLHAEKPAVFNHLVQKFLSASTQTEK